MNRFAKILISVFALLGVAFVGLTIFTTILVNTGCVFYTLIELPSPDSVYTASVQVEYCEASTLSELSLWVSRQDAPDTRGTVLSTRPATTEIYLEWRSGDTLAIRHPSALEIENKPSSLGDIRLQFEHTDSPR